MLSLFYVLNSKVDNLNQIAIMLFSKSSYLDTIFLCILYKVFFHHTKNHNLKNSKNASRFDVFLPFRIDMLSGIC